MFRRQAKSDRPDTTPLGRCIVLATEGRPIATRAVERAAALAKDGSDAPAEVYVLAIARVWGSDLGMPHPGLKPSARELQAQRDIVAKAIDGLHDHGVPARGEVVSSRHAAKRILSTAMARRAEAIVMTADAKPNWIARIAVWAHQPYVVERSAKIPVELVVEPAGGASHQR